MLRTISHPTSAGTNCYIREGKLSFCFPCVKYGQDSAAQRVRQLHARDCRGALAPLWDTISRSEARSRREARPAGLAPVAVQDAAAVPSSCRYVLL